MLRSNRDCLDQGRLHDLVVSTDALTPGEIRKHGAGVELHYGFGETPFGRALISWTGRGISFLGFCEETGDENVLRSLKKQWANAQFVEDSGAAQRWLDRVFDGSRDQPISVWLRGSPFQLKVWQALIRIPEGQHATYGQLATQIGHPGAARAAGTAIGANPVAWIIPCHRVIRQMGELGGYRWGEITKERLDRLRSRFRQSLNSTKLPSGSRSPARNCLICSAASSGAGCNAGFSE